MEKFYRITVLQKKGGFTYYFIDLSAKNAKEAKSNAENIWYKEHTSHAFHVTVKRKRITKSRWFDRYGYSSYYQPDLDLRFPHKVRSH